MSSARLPPQIRRAVAQRAQGQCEYCQCPQAYCPDSFTVDHIIPRHRGGTDDMENLAWACLGCNGRKHTKTHGIDPQTQTLIPLFNPRQQKWSEHFVWSENRQILTGQTSCGRATIAILDLNRQGVVNLRRVLLLVGEHPSQKDN